MLDDRSTKFLIDTNERLRWKLSAAKNLLKELQYDPATGKCLTCGRREGKQCLKDCAINAVIHM